MGKLGPRGGWGEAGHWVLPGCRGCGKTRGIRTCSVSCRRIAKMGGSSIFMQVLPIPGSTLSKSGKERFFTCSKGVEGCRYVNDEVNEPINR